jgi:hypothetical protein
MKKIVMLLSAFLVFAAHAGNEGPHATPGPVPRPGSYMVAEKNMRPGFVPPSMNFDQGVRVYSDGSVVSFGKQTIVFKVLDSRQLQWVMNQVRSIRETELVDLDADKPRCMDAPSFVWSVVKSSGAPELNIASWGSCHRFALKRNEGVALVRFLDQLDGEAHNHPPRPSR